MDASTQCRGKIHESKVVRQKKRDRTIAAATCDRNLWLASIVLSPHFIAHPRLLAAAAAGLLFAAGFRGPKRHHHRHDDQQPPPKRLKLHQKQAATPTSVTNQLSPLQQLEQAARQGDEPKLRELCQASCIVDVNQQYGPHSRTALHAAAEAGSVCGCKVLVALGADVYAVDAAGVTPLMLAAAGGHHSTLEVLLQSGADAFQVDYTGVNPLMRAAGSGSSRCIELLLQEGVDADYANTDLGGGEHALLLAAEAGGVECVQRLLSGGAKANRTDKAGRTALWIAARKGHTEVVRLLLSQPGVKHICSYGARSTTPLEEAQAARHTACVALLAAHMQQQQQQHTLSHNSSSRSQQQDVPQGENLPNAATVKQQQQQQQYSKQQQQQQQRKLVHRRPRGPGPMGVGGGARQPQFSVLLGGVEPPVALVC